MKAFSRILVVIGRLLEALGEAEISRVEAARHRRERRDLHPRLSRYEARFR